MRDGAVHFKCYGRPVRLEVDRADDGVHRAAPHALISGGTIFALSRRDPEERAAKSIIAVGAAVFCRSVNIPALIENYACLRQLPVGTGRHGAKAMKNLQVIGRQPEYRAAPGPMLIDIVASADRRSTVQRALCIDRNAPNWTSPVPTIALLAKAMENCLLGLRTVRYDLKDRSAPGLGAPTVCTTAPCRPQ